MPFSSASFRAKGDAITRPSLVELIFSFVGVAVVLVGVGSFSFFSGFAGCSSDGFFFIDDVTLPSSL
jgi:hypothetical protein